MELTDSDRRLVTVLERGLPMTSRPYLDAGEQAGLSEDEVLESLHRLLGAKIISRFGVIVRHHELGYKANAMVVWDIPDEQTGEIGRRFGTFDFVTLCYLRKRHLPQWPYNLYSMVHGRERDVVLAQVEDLAAACDLTHVRREVLFSGRRFKQRGAVYNPVETTP